MDDLLGDIKKKISINQLKGLQPQRNFFCAGSVTIEYQRMHIRFIILCLLTEILDFKDQEIPRLRLLPKSK